MKNMKYLFAGLGIAFTVAGIAKAALHSDNFNTAGSAADYVTVTTDVSSSFATFGYDYSALGIPSAPQAGDGTTRGLKLDANFAAPNAAEAITVFTKASFTGDYVVRFDAWLNVNGPFPDGGSGSTNYLTAGVGGDGTTNNFVANTGAGGWTAVNGENGFLANDALDFMATPVSIRPIGDYDNDGFVDTADFTLSHEGRFHELLPFAMTDHDYQLHQEAD